jgi:transcriptional regulator with XRE-family HTH domain
MNEPNTFGLYLRKIRNGHNGTALARSSGISYVYLLDIEKGARSVPRNDKLIKIAQNLSFEEGEKEIYFDLAAKEKNEIPADIIEYIKNNKSLVNLIRAALRKKISDMFWKEIQIKIENDKIEIKEL